MSFDGETYDPDLDGERLGTQLQRVFHLMRDGEWRTPREISAVVPGSESGLTARTRDFRKPKFGGHTVNKRRRGEGKRGDWEYQLIVRIEPMETVSQGELDLEL